MDRAGRALRLDGERPLVEGARRRLAAFWLPSQTVLYVGAPADAPSAGGRRRSSGPSSAIGGRIRAGTGSGRSGSLDGDQGVVGPAAALAEEYEDALLAAFARASRPRDWPLSRITTVVLPWANLKRPTGERKCDRGDRFAASRGRRSRLRRRRDRQLPERDAEGAHRGAARARTRARGRHPLRLRPEPRPLRAARQVGRRPDRRRRAGRPRPRAGTAAAAGPDGRGRGAAACRARRADSGQAPRRSSPGSGRPRSTATSRRTPNITQRARSSRSSRAGPGARGSAPDRGHRRCAERRLRASVSARW